MCVCVPCLSCPLASLQRRLSRSSSIDAGRSKSTGAAARPLARGCAAVPIILTVGARYCGGPVVLAAKTLTESDAKGRVILPRSHIENNLAWFVGTYR